MRICNGQVCALAGAVAGLLAWPAAAHADELAELKARMNALQDRIERLEAERTQAEDDAGMRLVNDQLGVASADGAFRLGAGGRIMVDGAQFREDGPRRLGDGTEVRRARIFLEGRLLHDWAFKGQYDFAGGEASINDLYLRYTGFDRLDVTLGHFREPFSLQDQTSSKYLTFMERALPDAFAPGRNLGVAASAHGVIAEGGWSATAGVFGEGADDAGDRDEGFGATGRITFAPVAVADRFAHVGVAAGYRDLGDVETLRLRTRPEAHATSTRLVDTGTLRGAEDLVRYGFEAALGFGPVSVQGEYMMTDVNVSGASDLDFDGWYVQGSWLLTGETRRYSARGGKFERLHPSRSLGHGGVGALEVGLRWSGIDLSDEGVSGGEERNFTAGINWYANPNVRVMANYVRVLDLEDTGLGAADAAEPSVLQLRAQVDF